MIALPYQGRSWFTSKCQRNSRTRKPGKRLPEALDVMLGECSWNMISPKFVFLLTLKLSCQASTHIQVIDIQSWGPEKQETYSEELGWYHSVTGATDTNYRESGTSELIWRIWDWRDLWTQAKDVLLLTSLVIPSKSLISGFLICKMVAHPSSFLYNSCGWGTVIRISGGVMAHACNPSTWKAQTGGSWIWGQSGVPRETVVQAKKWKARVDHELASCRENKTFYMGLSQVTFSVSCLWILPLCPVGLFLVCWQCALQGFMAPVM